MIAQRIPPSAMLTVKKYGFALGALTPLLMPAAYWLGLRYGAPNMSTFLPLLVIFFVVPLLEYAVGRETVNPDALRDVPKLRRDPYYRVLLWMCVPVQFAQVCWCAYVFAYSGLNSAGAVAWILGGGVIGTIVGIAPSHELIHRRSKTERFCGGLLLSSVLYPGYKVEHVWGHHVTVGTPDDPSSARRGESIYRFVPKAILLNVCKAFALERRLLARKGFRALSWKNELIWWYALSAVWAYAFYAVLGSAGIVYFLFQGLIATAILECINFIEHYGLRRSMLPDGGYEHVTHEHSWNSDYLLSNLILIHLQRHPHHHLHSTDVYAILRSRSDSPQLPGGYSAMLLLALVPLLWRRIIDARLDAYLMRVRKSATGSPSSPSA